MSASDRLDRDARLLPIGRLGRLAGLSVGALRHYDELDLLRPARIDPDTGYRWYREEQVDDARLIARLRELEMPLEEIRLLLAADDPAERLHRLAAHRTRIQARTDRLRHILHHLSTITTTEELIVPNRKQAPELDAETRRALAAGLFNRTWELLETVGRTPEQDDEMIHAAHASRYHWGEIGRPVNLARGEWQCARVYSTLGRGEPAMWHARRCLAILEANAGDVEDFDFPAAFEGLARAASVAGDTKERDRWEARARAALADIADPEDRALIEGDLDGIDRQR